MKKLLTVLLTTLLTVLLTFNFTQSAKGTTDEQDEQIEENEVTEECNKQIGIINRIYEVHGKKYIDVDMVEFYRGDKALEEAIKDDKALYDKELGGYWVPDGYYIRNNDNTIKTYEVGEDSQYYLCVYEAGDESATNSAETKEVPYDYFKEKINSYLSTGPNRGTLVWISQDNGEVYKIEKQYTP